MMSTTPHLQLGCVADDFTGAGDIASFIGKSCERVLLINGVPEADYRPREEYDAVVIALKSRTAPIEEAVEQTRRAFDWLRAQGAQKLYFKYCSTFDSTPRGNIGPVLDHLLERYDLPYTILCPALPVNKRTVRDGILYVDGVPLAEGPMRFHPLNPMWDSRVSALMESQSRYRCYELTHEMYRLSDEQILAKIAEWERENEHFYIVVDYFEEAHGARIAKLFGHLPLYSGGSVLAQHLTEMLKSRKAPKAPANGAPRSVLLAGSCSEMTLKQVGRFLSDGGIAQRVSPQKLLSGEQTAQSLWQFAKEHPGEDILFYSSQPHEEIAAIAQHSQGEISQALERLMAQLGKRAVDSGVRRIIVAGGETSGAVMQAIGENAYSIGPSVAPGVPILTPVSMDNIRLVLKSGNFGLENFFIEALGAMDREGI